MTRRSWAAAAALVIAAAATLVVAVLIPRFAPERPGLEPLPEFPDVDVQARKEAFFDYLRPIVRYHNEDIRKEREWLLDIAEDGSPGWFQRRRLEQLAERYRVDMDSLGVEETIAVLVRRIDTLPESLVLVQAAKESGWGSSRFAREGNALFGQRCFAAGCGIVPGARAPGLTHEVRSFDTVLAAVESYLLNLNTHERYIAMRRARRDLRVANEPVTGTRLAEYLDFYSERRDAYIEELKSMIRYNDLDSE